MAKIKKTFDRELMYKKIMPSNLKKDNEQAEEDESIALNEDKKYPIENNTPKETSIFQNK